MEQNKKEQTTNEEKDWQCGCFKPSSRFGRVMMKMMKKMCGSMNKDKFGWESIMKEMKCCSATK